MGKSNNEPLKEGMYYSPTHGLLTVRWSEEEWKFLCKSGAGRLIGTWSAAGKCLSGSIPRSVKPVDEGIAFLRDRVVRHRKWAEEEEKRTEEMIRALEKAKEEADLPQRVLSLLSAPHDALFVSQCRLKDVFAKLDEETLKAIAKAAK